MARKLMLPRVYLVGVFFGSSKTMEVGAVEVEPWFDLLQDTPKKKSAWS